MYTGGWYRVRKALGIAREKTGISKVSELQEQYDELLKT